MINDLNNAINIVIYEHDRPFANLLGETVRKICMRRATLNTGDLAQMAAYIYSAHPSTVYLLDLMDENHFLAGKRLLEHIEETSKGRDRVIFVTRYTSEVRDDVFLDTKSYATVYKHHPRFLPMLEDKLLLTLRDVAGDLIALKVQGEVHIVHPSEINHIETASHNYLRYVFDGGRRAPLEVGGLSLDAVSTSLKLYGFRRVHRFYAINTGRVDKWNPLAMTVTFEDGSEVPFRYNYISASAVYQQMKAPRICIP